MAQQAASESCHEAKQPHLAQPPPQQQQQ